ncbi:MAG: AAA family ATPase [Candidatus Omnitrophica bacterium]|nr:AAA family ATPase [Candidatus Omnitrophota bacterium]
MSYFKLLGLYKEPFSTSPDPEFFYMTREHEAALTNLLIDLRLRRGLSVILGDVGTGKTTLSRKLVQELKVRNDFVFRIMLDPSYPNESSFMRALLDNFNIAYAGRRQASPADLRHALKRFLLKRGVSGNRIVVLIIDEAQKLSLRSLELLRGLLNFETNDYKLIQIVLLGQLELYPKLVGLPNLLDRISFKSLLRPLDLDEAREMIDFRMHRAGYQPQDCLFDDEAVRLIHEHSQGYPRRITMLCHKALKEAVLKNASVINAGFMRSLMSAGTAGWHNIGELLSEENQIAYHS